MSYTFHFVSVGMSKKFWTAILPDTRRETIIEEVKRSNAIKSKDVDVTLYAQLAESGRGTILVGRFREAGKFHYTKTEPTNEDSTTKQNEEGQRTETAQTLAPGSALEVQPTSAPVPQNGGAPVTPLTIIQLVRREAAGHLAQTGKKATTVFLGEKEWNEMREAAAPFIKMESPPATEEARAEFCGMKIFKIDAPTWIATGVQADAY